MLLCRDETFGGLSGMLRQILSPTAESEDLNYATNVHLLQQQQSQNLYNTHASVLSSTLQMTPSESLSHQQQDMVMQEQTQQQQQTGYQDQVQILTETHICPNCGIKLTYQIRTAHNNQLMDLGEPQLMRFTCYACSRTFVASSHVKPLDQMQQLPPIPPRLQSPTSPSQMHYQSQPTEVAQQTLTPTSQRTEKSFSCDRCQASFRYRTLLEKHKKMHDLAAGQDKPYSCSRCFMRFETRNLYNHHAKTHKPAGTQSARNSAPSSSKDNTTILYNKANNTYSCETCAKEFPTIESLTSHKAVHRSRPLVCDVCGKGFTHRKYYVVHQRIHTGERPYLCAMCGKSFTQASTLTVHRRYHTGERPYTCTLCGKGFVTRTIMLNHMKKH